LISVGPDADPARGLWHRATEAPIAGAIWAGNTRTLLREVVIRPWLPGELFAITAMLAAR